MQLRPDVADELERCLRLGTEPAWALDCWNRRKRMESLETTKVLLMAVLALSVAQTAIAVVLAIAAMRAYRTTTHAMDTKFAPALVRIEMLLSSLEATSAVARSRTDDMSRAVNAVHDAAGQIGAALWPRATVAAGLAGGLLSIVRRRRLSRRAPELKVVAG